MIADDKTKSAPLTPEQFAHLGDGAVVQMAFMVLALLPGHLLADRVGVGMFVRVGGDLSQLGLMAATLALMQKVAVR